MFSELKELLSEFSGSPGSLLPFSGMVVDEVVGNH